MDEATDIQDIGPLWAHLAEIGDLLTTDPVEAEKQTRAFLKLAPGQPHALCLLVDALRMRGDLAGGRALLESLTVELPNLAAAHYELGLLLSELGEREAAIRALSRTVELEPRHPAAWRALGDALAESGDTEGAAKAYARHFASSVVDLKMLENMSALGPDQAEVAANMVREFLKIYPTDVFATHMFGRMYMKANLFEPAEQLFARALELAPDFETARQDYLTALYQQHKWQSVIEVLDKDLEEEPDNPDTRFARVHAIVQLADYSKALPLFEELLRDFPDRAKFWTGYANVLRSVGRRDESIAAYRKSIELRPATGAAWWGLADLMAVDFSPGDLSAMHAALRDPAIEDDDRYYLHFALGEALEAKQSYEDSFEHFLKGNALRRAQLAYNANEMTANVQRVKKYFTRDFFRAHASLGCQAPDPIFIVGLARSGSTLVEQILSSHASIEGAGELPTLIPLAGRLEAKVRARASSGDGETPALADEDLKSLGEDYLAATRVYRKLGRPLFTDKTPNNFYHVALICSALPNAKIIDVRRHPLACCFSNFKQLFPWGLPHTYGLTDIGRYYRDYVELMAHFDSVLPGRVHRVFYEDLVRDTEREARRLFEYCGVAFEPKSLRFYENDRPVVTISSEQVRQPIYIRANEQWRPYERWLDPLKDALGPVLDAYPNVPEGV